MKRRWFTVCSASPGLVNDALILRRAINASGLGKASSLVVSENLAIRLLQIFGLFLRRLVGVKVGVVFLEDIRPSFWHAAKFRVLVPNPEWMRAGTLKKIESLDGVWCKTLHAFDIYKARDIFPKYLGFSSIDRYLDGVEKNYRSFIHIQGRSMQKGTLELLRLWVDQPDWPVLNVVSRDKSLIEYQRENIKFFFDYIPDDKLNDLMNASGVHLCVSTAEGFGHSINEALSCKSVVVTTDAVPMNELVPDGVGYKVRTLGSDPLGWSMTHKIDEIHLKEVLQTVISADLNDLSKIGEAARVDFLRRQRDFEGNLTDLLSDCLVKNHVLHRPVNLID